MAWEWSHTPEAYAKAEKQLRKKSKKWLSICYGEIKAYSEDDHFNEKVYEESLTACKDMARESLADFIWRYASVELRTCENGGYSPWMCPNGCHTVEW